MTMKNINIATIDFVPMSNAQRYLHRYRSLDGKAASFVEATVCRNELYFARPSSFNDPFDCRPSFSMEAPKARLRKYYEGVYSRQAPSMSRAVRRAESKSIARDPLRSPSHPDNLRDFKATYHASVTEKIGLLCLSEVPDDLLMWSHYADSHRGVCLVFDWQAPFFAEAQAVTYQKRRPCINPILQSRDEMLDNALLTKSDHWRYEKEWRVFQYKQGFGKYSFPPSTLVGIILGAQISEANRAMVHGWLVGRGSPIAVFQTALSDAEFTVTFEPCLG